MELALISVGIYALIGLIIIGCVCTYDRQAWNDFPFLVHVSVIFAWPWVLYEAYKRDR